MKYIVLGKWTDYGRKNIKDLKKINEEGNKLIEEQNGSVSVFFTMGEYDFVAIIDMPDEESMVKTMMKLYTNGTFLSNTLKAWPDSEFMKMISEIN